LSARLLKPAYRRIYGCAQYSAQFFIRHIGESS
jgi:hypothetical protein